MFGKKPPTTGSTPICFFFRYFENLWPTIHHPFQELCFTPRKTNMEPENEPPGRGDSYYKPSFSGSMLVFGGVYPLSIHSLGSWDVCKKRGPTIFRTWPDPSWGTEVVKKNCRLQTEVPNTSSAKIWRHAVWNGSLYKYLYIYVYILYIYIYISIIGRSHDDLRDISSSLLHQFEWWIIFSLRTCNLPPH